MIFHKGLGITTGTKQAKEGPLDEVLGMQPGSVGKRSPDKVRGTLRQSSQRGHSVLREALHLRKWTLGIKASSGLGLSWEISSQARF